MKGARARIWTVGVALLAMATVGAFVLGHMAADVLLLPATLTREGRREVPDLVGRSVESARERAEDAGSAVDLLGLAYSAERDSGEVLFQYPLAGMPLEPGQPVEVVVSAGRGGRRVPDVRELSERSAREVLQVAGIPVAGVAPVAEEGFEEGMVVSTEPPAGARVARGDSVVLRVNRGVAIVEVPELIGKRQEEAGEILQDANLRVGRTTFEEQEPAGSVIVLRQDPPAGGLARAGAAVDLHLGSAPGEQE